MRRRRRLGFGFGAIALFVGLSWPLAERAEAATVPNGFSEIDVVSGLNAATSFDFAPDGQLFVAEKRASCSCRRTPRTRPPRCSPTSAPRCTTATTAASSTWSSTLPTRSGPSCTSCTGPMRPSAGRHPPTARPTPTPIRVGPDSCLASTRVSRLRADGDRMAEETVLVDATCTEFPIHDGGGLAFGADGALYASFGDGAWANIEYGQYSMNACGDPPGPPGEAPTPPGAEGGSLRSQDLRTDGDPAGLNGAVVRIDPNSGAALPENPRFGSEDLEERRIVGYGLRNPFRLTTRPGTSEVWVGDVGGATWEEIDRIPPGGPDVPNFGWPCYEGSGRLAGFDKADLALCEGLYAEPGAETTPFFAYRHRDPVVAGETCWVGPGAAGRGSELGDQRAGLLRGRRLPLPLRGRALLRRLLPALPVGHAGGCGRDP